MESGFLGCLASGGDVSLSGQPSPESTCAATCPRCDTAIAAQPRVLPRSWPRAGHVQAHEGLGHMAPRGPGSGNRAVTPGPFLHVWRVTRSSSGADSRPSASPPFSSPSSYISKVFRFCALSRSHSGPDLPERCPRTRPRVAARVCPGAGGVDRRAMPEARGRAAQPPRDAATGPGGRAVHNEAETPGPAWTCGSAAAVGFTAQHTHAPFLPFK